jgi:hypothetical protein
MVCRLWLLQQHPSTPKAGYAAARMPALALSAGACHRKMLRNHSSGYIDISFVLNSAPTIFLYANRAILRFFLSLPHQS